MAEQLRMDLSRRESVHTERRFRRWDELMLGYRLPAEVWRRLWLLSVQRAVSMRVVWEEWERRGDVG